MTSRRALLAHESSCLKQLVGLMWPVSNPTMLLIPQYAITSGPPGALLAFIIM